MLSNKGIVFGITVARDITNLYQSLSNENKLIFKKINEYQPNYKDINDAINNYQKSQDKTYLIYLI